MECPLKCGAIVEISQLPKHMEDCPKRLELLNTQKTENNKDNAKMKSVPPKRPPQYFARMVFNEFDADKDGSITIQEFSNLLKKYNVNFTDKEMNYALQLVDRDNSGTIEFCEFEPWFNKEKKFDSLRDAIIEKDNDIPIKESNKSDNTSKQFDVTISIEILMY